MFDPIVLIFELLGVELVPETLTMAALIPYMFSVICCLVIIVTFINFIRYMITLSMRPFKQ